ncbi:MAG: glutathione S-transferase [Hyphomicrobiales bacterium]|nr:glutathione S-transferase [Hyphomicrobiales bacterium]
MDHKSKNNLPILYSFRRCPYAMRARMAIHISGQRCELREVLLRDKPPSMLEYSAKGTVPVLILQDGKVIDESLDVIDWALNLNDPDDWQRSKDKEKTKELIKINDGEFKYHLDRYKYSKRYDNEDPEFHRKKCLKFIESINNELNNSEYIFDDNISYADIVLLPFIRQFRIADIEWFDSLPYDNLKKWLSSFLGSSLLNSIMKKYDLWKEGDKSIVF